MDVTFWKVDVNKKKSGRRWKMTGTLLYEGDDFFLQAAITLLFIVPI